MPSYDNWKTAYPPKYDEDICPDCEGTGRDVRRFECATCRGEGVEHDEEERDPDWEHDLRNDEPELFE